ncbi:saccharopine dehydrogenase NADP-binding domain-containing protein [Robertkochia solimangrovi]|uniref:saccharopine dehydrogenase NADP-binding domain-containing protein n=1 Tax=Robertkochia solimangrovi TaxID=2213046 RepID=UPI0011804F62|nr:saccharopine dehydrogenase NADP-binding domain-containing protein [Robertkochia solimangrovi]TRZ41954.1 saccharopine dehydrogenase [Robertkochia solimangrovi]
MKRTHKNLNNKIVTVIGAYGHTGKFVIAELLKEGFIPVLAGRNKEKLQEIGKKYPNLEIRHISIDNPQNLDNAVNNSFAIINCAGPFLDTAMSIIECALRNNIHYLDMTAEQQCVISIYEQFAKRARKERIVILPAMAFFGGLADLLATSLMDKLVAADTINISVALDNWMPTLGTRKTGSRNIYPRFTYRNKKLIEVPTIKPKRMWQFSEPFGSLEVESFPLTEIITISKHLNVNEINTYMNLAPLMDIRNPETPTPVATKENGLSSQVFIMEVEACSNKKTNKIVASGIDIYGITAPLIVEALIRIEQGLFKEVGVVSAGETFDSSDFLDSLATKGFLDIK